MPDNKTKKRADGKRVALDQAHERRYLLRYLERLEGDLTFATDELQGALDATSNAISRLRAGFPATTKGKRRGK